LSRDAESVAAGGAQVNIAGLYHRVPQTRQYCVQQVG
jgi:hypothetical protein